VLWVRFSAQVINKEAEWESAMRFLEELTSHDSSYKLYRSALHGSVPPCVPYLGTHLHSVDTDRHLNHPNLTATLTVQACI
jgi:hypothetical protein